MASKKLVKCSTKGLVTWKQIFFTLSTIVSIVITGAIVRSIFYQYKKDMLVDYCHYLKHAYTDTSEVYCLYSDAEKFLNDY